MKSTTDGVKHYSKGVKVNARRKGALKRLENNLISIINLRENSDKQLKIINSNEELLISETEHIESLRDSILTRFGKNFLLIYADKFSSLIL